VDPGDARIGVSDIDQTWKLLEDDLRSLMAE
jgi:hypothetical protein